MRDRQFAVTAAMCVCLIMSVSTLAQVEVTVAGAKRQQMIYGMDFERLWHWGLTQDELTRLAELAVKDCHVSYIRVAIDGAAEYNEGEFNWSAYDRQLECMAALKAANPDIRFFAIPRPFHEAIRGRYAADSPEVANAPYICFPLWIAIFENPFDQANRKFVEFKWDKAADYMVRHIRFLNSKGFKISYVDTKNENDRYFRPAELSKMIQRMRDQLGDEMPLVVGPSSYDWQSGTRWLEDAIAADNTSFFDIAASHNTKNRGSAEQFAQLAASINKPVWNTELHGFQGPDAQAAANTEILWHHIRAGFGGINDWLSLGNERKEHKMFRNIDGRLEVMRTYFIFRHLVNTSTGGHYLHTNVPDELTATAAFAKDDIVTVWLLSRADDVVSDVVVRLDATLKISGPIEVTWWAPDNDRKGSATEIVSTSESSFTHAIAANALYCFKFRRH